MKSRESYKNIYIVLLVTTLPDVSETWVNTVYKCTVVVIVAWLSTKIKNTVFNEFWDRFWDAVYYRRFKNLDLLKSLASKEAVLEEQLIKLRTSGHSYPEFSQEVDQLTEKSQQTRKSFPDIPFSLFSLSRKLCLHVRQCYTSKADKLKLDSCHNEIDECLGNLEKEITSQNKANEQIHHPSSNIGFAINPSPDNKPYQITDFSVTPDDGSLQIQ